MGDFPHRLETIPRVEEYRTLLAISEAIVSDRDLQALFHDLAGQLHPVVHFDHLGCHPYDATSNTMRLHVLETSGPRPDPWFTPVPREDSPPEVVLQQLKAETFECVFISPPGRPRRTCKLAGLGARG
jgi:hypothetical protein